MQISSGRTILVGEDELDVRGYFQIALRSLGYSVELAQDGDEVLSFLRASRGEVQAILLDVMMPNRDGIETLREIREIDPDVPVIMVSGSASSLDIVSAMKCGATDFLCKPVAHEELRKAISRCTEANGNGSVAPPRVSPQSPGYYLANNPRMREIQALVGQIGWSEAPVLIQGETGSGKEMLARELIARSPRAGKAFLKINCAALPSELVESELFGYERGAFTGAFQKKAGMFENADRGTVLLDEIGDMDIRLQAKLLQVLQDSSFQRIGGKETIKVDVRIMAATHRDLEKCIADRTFREDLFYRLNVINIHLPALRERREDVLPLTDFLIQKHAPKGTAIPPVTPALQRALMNYHWPGNVRELENYVRKFLIFRDPEALATELSAKMVRVVAPAGAGRVEALPAPAAEVAPVLEQVVRAKQRAETGVILSALNATRWNRKRAASMLKIDYKALLYKMKKLGIEDGPAAAAPNSGTPSVMGVKAHGPDSYVD
jgi:two-component system, NtrC family, response regulator AtoC